VCFLGDLLERENNGVETVPGMDMSGLKPYLLLPDFECNDKRVFVKIRRMVIAVLQASLLVLAISACGPAPVDHGQLYPDPQSDRVRGESYLSETFPENKEIREKLVHTLTVGNDSMRMFVELEEHPAFVEAKVVFLNATQSIFDIGALDFALFDGNDVTLNPVGCHVLANAIVGPGSDVQPYQPKPSYSFNKTIVGESGQSQYNKPVVVEDLSLRKIIVDQLVPESPANIFRGLGTIFVFGKNSMERSAAEQLYDSGIGDRVGIVPDSQHEFSVFWRNEAKKEYPLRLVLLDTDIDFTFGTEKENR
jgi:hypothetical protein